VKSVGEAEGETFFKKEKNKTKRNELKKKQK